MEKMSKIIKDILEVTDGVLGRPATRGQVIQVLELIESFEATKEEGNVVTKVEATKEEGNVVTKVEATKPRAKRRTISGNINWDSKKRWMDLIIDGDPHVIGYAEMNKEVPGWRYINRSSLRNRFRVEAVKRGYSSVSVKFNDSKGFIVVDVNQ